MDTVANRNNNPGNLKDPSTGSFRTFSSPQEGYAALLNDLEGKMTATSSTGLGPNSSLIDFAKTYAPASDSNNPAQYAANLANRLKVRPDTTLRELQPRLGEFADAIAGNEGFKVAPSFVNPNANVSLQNRFVNPPPDINTSGASMPDLPAAPKQGLLSKIGHGALGVLNQIESPFAGIGAIPVQALAKITGQPDPYAEGIPGFAGTSVPVSKLGLEQKAGDMAQVGSYFVPGEGILGAAGAGALQGGGQAMSQGADLPTVATNAGLGAAIAGGTAAATKLVGAGINKLGESLSGEGQNKAIQGIKDAYGSALNLNASERGFESRSGKDLAQVLLENQAPLGRYENGTLDASGAIEKLQAALDPLNQEATQAVTNAQGVVHDIPLQDTYQAVIDRINKSKISPLDKQGMIAGAKKLFAAASQEYGDVLPPQVAETLKQSLQSTAFKGALMTSDKLQGDVTYLASDALRKNIEQAISKTDTATDLGALNIQRSNLIDAINRLTKLDGVRLLKGGRLGNMAGGLKGAIVGAASGLGSAGALAGDYFGEKAAQFLNNPATKIATAQLKSKAYGFLPKLLGGAAKPVGEGISTLGQGVSKSARFTGLLGNLLMKK